MNSNNKRIKRWTDITSNPNSAEAYEYRTKILENARNVNSIANREEYISSLSKDKHVLDIGIVEHYFSSAESKEWLHGRICESAKSCLGIDILENEIHQLREMGYNAIVWDITKASLPHKYDLIIIGEVIEHLENSAALFSNTSKMLLPGGRIILSTPNPWYVNVIIKNIFNGKPFTDSVDHVAWYDAGTLCELASRYGLLLEKYLSVKFKKSKTFRSAIVLYMSQILVKLGIRPEFFAKTMIYEFVREDHTSES